ncbi:MAG: hypothetical protein FWF46_00350 [Oscillospiraceae bacterium]|nr:hypothetical protein [Oscillospiraceae bacterium]
MGEDLKGLRGCSGNSCGPLGGLFGDNGMLLIVLFLLFFSNGFGCDRN